MNGGERDPIWLRSEDEDDAFPVFSMLANVFSSMAYASWTRTQKILYSDGGIEKVTLDPASLKSQYISVTLLFDQMH